MDRLTTPDRTIEGGIERAVIDIRDAKKNAIMLYWQLKRYEDTGLTPEQMIQTDRLYLEKCKEVTALREKQRWIPIYERLPEANTDVLVLVREIRNREEFETVGVDCLIEYENGNKLIWGTYNGATEMVEKWMPIPATAPMPENIGGEE